MNCSERCADCPLQDRTIVPGRGLKNDMMIIGEAPGYNEAYQGRPFVGTSGKLLRDTLKAAGITPARTYMTNVALCHPPQNKFDSRMIEACKDRLLQEIVDVNPTKILALGTRSLQALFGKDARVTKERGIGQYVEVPVTYKDVERRKWKSVWHPVDQVSFDMITTEERYVPIRGTEYFYDMHTSPEHKEFKIKGSCVKVWQPVPYFERVPDQMRKIFIVSTWHPSAILRNPDNFREFALDIEKFKRQDAPIPTPRIDLWVVRDVPEAIAALDMIRQAKILGCDTETTGLDPRNDTILSIGFGALTRDDPDYDGVAVIIPRELVYQHDVVRKVQTILDGSAHDGTLIFHNIKFDLQMLHAAGYTILDPHRTHPSLMDTMMMAYHWDERPSLPDEQGEVGATKPQGRSLKTLARVFYDIADYHFDFPAFFAQMAAGTLTEDDWNRMYAYHGLDCFLTARLYIDLKQRLDEESPKLYPIARDFTVPACHTFAAIEYRGIKINVPYLEDLKIDYALTMQEHFDHLQMAWDANRLPNMLRGSAQSIMHLLKSYKINVEDTQRNTLLHWKARTPKDDPRRDIVDHLIQYRLYKQMIGTFIQGMINRIDDNGRLHPTFLIDGTATTRLSCRNPNLQNIPSRMGSAIRRAFIPSDGMVLLNADYSQVQPRIAASKLYANDASMREAYIQRQDIYKVVAGKMYHIDKDDVIKIQRGYAKTVFLGTLFEQTAQGIIEGREMALMKDAGEEVWTLEDAEYFQNEFFEQFPGFREYMNRQHALGWQRVKEGNCYIEDPIGKRRRFPFIAPGMRGHVERQWDNTPIQMGEADVVTNGINQLHREYTRTGKAHLLLSVHDSIMAELYPEDVEEIAEITRPILENSCPFEIDIPLLVDIEVGNNWADLIPVERWLAENSAQFMLR